MFSRGFGAIKLAAVFALCYPSPCVFCMYLSRSPRLLLVRSFATVVMIQGCGHARIGCFAQMYKDACDKSSFFVNVGNTGLIGLISFFLF